MCQISLRSITIIMVRTSVLYLIFKKQKQNKSTRDTVNLQSMTSFKHYSEATAYLY